MQVKSDGKGFIIVDNAPGDPNPPTRFWGNNRWERVSDGTSNSPSYAMKFPTRGGAEAKMLTLPAPPQD